MAIRLYFVANALPEVAPAFDAAWQSSAQAFRRYLRTAAQGGKQAATESWSGALGGAVNDNDCIVMGITSPLQGDQSILAAGNWTGISRGQELAANDNINNRGRTLRVWDPSSGTYRGTLVANGYSASTTELSNTALAGQQHALNGGLTLVNALHGDVVVVELGYRETVTGTTPQWTTAIGGNGTDHGTANNDATGTVPWVEFSQDLVFQTSPPILVMAPPNLS